MRSYLLAGALAAATLAFAALPATAAPAPTWNVDKAASHLGFSSAMNGQAFNGGFGRWDAQIAFDPNNLAASHVTAVIDMASAKTGDQSRDEAMPTGDWFSVKAFPRATFTTRKINAAGPGHYIAVGDLTIRNITRPVSLPFSLAIAGETAKMNGALPIDRSVFGVGQGQWKGGDTVDLKVQINVTITAKRAH
ncbi:MAG: YceI family protein [Caulobacteraceae bacterium]